MAYSLDKIKLCHKIRQLFMKATLFLLTILSVAQIATANDTTVTTITSPITEGFTIDDGTRHELIMSVKKEEEAGKTPIETTKALDLKNGTISVTGAGSELYVETDGSLSIGSATEGTECTAKIVASDGGKITLIGSQTNHSNYPTEGVDNFNEAHHFWVGATENNVVANVELSAQGAGSQFLIDFRDFSGNMPGSNWGGFFTGTKTNKGSKGEVTLSALDGGTMTVTNVDDYTQGAFYGQFFQAMNEKTNLIAKNGGTLAIGGMYSSFAHTNVEIASGGTMNVGHNFNINPAGLATISVDGADSSLNFLRELHLSSAGNTISVSNGGVINVAVKSYTSYAASATFTVKDANSQVNFANYNTQGYNATDYGIGATHFEVSNEGAVTVNGIYDNIGGITIMDVSSNALVTLAKYYNRNYTGSNTGSSEFNISQGGVVKITEVFLSSDNAVSTFNITDGGKLLGNELYANGTMAPIYQNVSTSIFNIDGTGATEGSTGMAFYSYINYSGGNTTFNVKNGGIANIGSYTNQENSTTTINLGEFDATTPLTLATAEEESTASNQTFQVSRYTNYGTTNFNVAQNSKVTIGTYVNSGDSTINAADGSTIQFNELQLLNGNMNLLGDGEYVLGSSGQGTATNTLFLVSDSTTSTNINFAETPNLTFTIDGNTQFTLQFSDEALAGITEGSSGDFELVLVYGNSAFGEYMEKVDLVALLSNTNYVFGSNADADDDSTYTVMEGSATYKKDGNNLVWTGTINNGVVPEPGTATLSLLGLTAMLMRRRRKND